MAPTPTADIAAAFVALLPVLAGGLVAIIAAAIGPILTNIFEGKATRRQQRLTRFEEMMSSFYSYEIWVEARRLHYQFGQEAPSMVSPLNRTATLAALHFPSVEEGIDKLRSVEKKYTVWMAESGNRRLSGKLDTVNDGFDEAYRAWYGQFSQVERALQQVGRTIERIK